VGSDFFIRDHSWFLRLAESGDRVPRFLGSLGLSAWLHVLFVVVVVVHIIVTHHVRVAIWAQQRVVPDKITHGDSAAIVALVEHTGSNVGGVVTHWAGPLPSSLLSRL